MSVARGQKWDLALKNFLLLRIFFSSQLNNQQSTIHGNISFRTCMGFSRGHRSKFIWSCLTIIRLLKTLSIQIEFLAVYLTIWWHLNKVHRKCWSRILNAISNLDCTSFLVLWYHWYPNIHILEIWMEPIWIPDFLLCLDHQFWKKKIFSDLMKANWFGYL